MAFGKYTVAKAPPKTLTSWSFSRYSDWVGCPLKAKLKHIDRLREPPNPAMERGAAIHTMAEQYIKGELPAKLPAELVKFADEFKQLRKAYKSKLLPLIVEDQWAFDKEWSQSRWDDWTHCWLRIKLDCAHYEGAGKLVVIDWKTGKPSQYKLTEYAAQMELYALAALLLHPTLDEVEVKLCFLDVGETYPKEPKVYTQADVKELRATWSKRVKPMMTDEKFVAKPSSACKWCYFGQAGVDKGGPGLCKF